MAENENKPKKPHSVRGKHRVLRQKSWTDKKGNLHTKPSWEYEPRSGYGSAFLSTFTLFLAIVVVFNIVMGTGYKGYKQAVRALYTTTETVGGVVRFVSGNILNFGEEPSNDYYYTENGLTLTTGEVVTLSKGVYTFENEENSEICVIGQYALDWWIFFGVRATQDVVVYDSTGTFSVGEKVTFSSFLWFRRVYGENPYRELSEIDGYKFYSDSDGNPFDYCPKEVVQ